MKVLLINNFHYPKGGSETVYFNTSNLLKSQRHEVSHFSINHSQNIESEFALFFAENHDYRKLSLYKKIFHSKTFIYNNNSAQALENLIKVYKPDVAHIHLFLGGLTTSILKVLRKNKVPVVHTAHDYRLICPAYLCINGNMNVCEKCISDKFYLRCTINRCSEHNHNQSLMLTLESYFRKYFVKPVNYIDHFIFVSRFSRNKHILFDESFNSKSSLLYNFIPDLDNIETNSKKGNYFLYFGRLSREKGMEFLIDAIKDLKVNLKIVGSGPLYTDLQKQSNNNVDLLGFKTGEELKTIIRNASFVLVPSEWYENNPMAIIESFSMGKPVIGSSIGGIPELILNGGNGFLFNPGNKEELVKLLKRANEMDVDEYEIFSKNARSFAEENFNPEKHYQRLLSIYEDVIHKYPNA